jgi:hypothetical protein
MLTGVVVVDVTVAITVAITVAVAVVVVRTVGEGWATVVVIGIAVTSLLCATAVSLPLEQPVQRNKKSRRPMINVVDAWDTGKKWCNRFTGTNLLALFRFGVIDGQN